MTTMRRRPMLEEAIHLPGEEWRDWPGHSQYEVSSLGRVRRKAYIVGGTSSKGYRKLAFYPEGHSKPKFEMVHRAVATAFHGNGGALHVAHLNGDPKDNRAENLAWVSHTENMKHKWLHDTQQHGERVWNAKLTASQALEARRRGDAGESPAKIARDFGVGREAIRDIIARKNWKHLAD